MQHAAVVQILVVESKNNNNNKYINNNNNSWHKSAILFQNARIEPLLVSSVEKMRKLKLSV